jgi:hypothetical protein
MDISEKDIFTLQLDEIQPSQLFISRSKLNKILRSYDYIHPKTITPVSVKMLDGELIYTDGHTRAFALHQEGQLKVRAIWESDELDWEAYRICVDWCKGESIQKIGDLKDRIIDSTEYMEKWISRCRKMQKELKEKRQSESAKP